MTLVAVKEYTDAADIFAARRALQAKFYAPKPVKQPAAVIIVPELEPEVMVCPREAWLRDWLSLASPLAVKPMPARIVLVVVSEKTGVSIEEMMGVRRQAKLVKARQMASWLMRRHTRLSYPQIAGKLGGRDHTTILHACAAIDRLCEADPDFKQLLGALSAEIIARAAA